MSRKTGRVTRKATDMPPALKSVDVQAVLRQRGFFMKQRENQRLKAAARDLAAQIVKKQRAARGKKASKTIIQMPQKYNSFSDEVVFAYRDKTVGDVEAIEKHFDTAVRKFLVNEVLAKALANLHGAIDESKNLKTQKKALVSIRKDIFSDDDESELVNKAILNLEPILQNMGVISGQDANKLIGISTPYVLSDALKKRIKENVDKFTQSMVETDQDHLTSLIVAGIDAGQSVPEISAEIRSDFTEYSKSQSTRITRTEVLRSANQGAVDAFKQSGVVSGKQWVIAGAEDECASYDGDIVTLDGDFYGVEGEFQDGDPPLHPNCKCVVVPVLVDDSEKELDNTVQKQALRKQIKELENKIDKRTKAYKDLKAKADEEKASDRVYIKALERHLGVADESAR